jgi:protein TonB
MPEFPGGAAAMNNFIVSNLRYPLLAQENGIQGRVYCQFVVNTDGSITDVNIVRGVEASLHAESVRLVKSMPKWTPGREGGKAVRCRFNLPIRFKLQ